MCAMALCRQSGYYALVLLLIMLIAAPLLTHIPLVILAAILLTVAYNMDGMAPGSRAASLRIHQRYLAGAVLLI